MEVHHKDRLGCYPLHHACSDDYHKDVVIKLIEVFPEAARHKKSSGLYPLHIALIHHKSEDVLMKLIESFPKAVFESPRVGTALHLACKRYARDDYQFQLVITKLIEINPLSIQVLNDRDKRYPIYYAILRHHSIAVIKLLLDGDPLGMQRSSKRNVNGNPTPFHLACDTIHPQLNTSHAKLVNYELVEYLLQRSDLQINIRDYNGETPLHYAINDVKTTEMLLRHPRVNVNATRNCKSTPLHNAVTFYHCQMNYQQCCHNTKLRFPILRKLLDHPFILINQKNDWGGTPLDFIKSHLKGLIRRNRFEKINDIKLWRKCEIACVMKMVHLLEEFTIKRRWRAYCYHVKNLIDL